MKKALILFLGLVGCGSPAVQKAADHIAQDKAKALAVYCSQPYELRLAAHQAAVTAVAAAAHNPLPAMIAYVDPCPK